MKKFQNEYARKRRECVRMVLQKSLYSIQTVDRTLLCPTPTARKASQRKKANRTEHRGRERSREQRAEVREEKGEVKRARAESGEKKQ
jgi:hypothetical protein